MSDETARKGKERTTIEVRMAVTSGRGRTCDWVGLTWGFWAGWQVPS